MEVTLRKAHAFSEGLLSAARKLPVAPAISLSIHETDPTKVIGQATTIFEKNFTRSNKYLQAAYAIRRLIGEANAASGVNAILVSRALMDAQEKALSGLLDTGTLVSNDQIEGALSAARERFKSHGYGADTLQVVLLTEARRGDVSRELQTLRRSKATLNDQLLTLNMTTKITIPTQHVESLREAGLIE